VKTIHSCRIDDTLRDEEIDTFLADYAEIVMGHGLQIACREGKLVVEKVPVDQGDPLALFSRR